MSKQQCGAYHKEKIILNITNMKTKPINSPFMCIIGGYEPKKREHFNKVFNKNLVEHEKKQFNNEYR